MKNSGQRSRSVMFAVAFLSLALVVAATPSAQAQTFTLLHSFPSANNDGETPYGALVLDKDDNLYGTTFYGGVGSNYGTVFEIDTFGEETLLYLFGLHGKGHDGVRPSGQIAQYKGIIYGTTQQGGGAGCNAAGCGTVFQLYKGKETVLHSFTGLDGVAPAGGVVRDDAGNLYGTTVQGSGGTIPPACPSYGCGTVFGVIQGQETLLYSFGGMPDGVNPSGSLVVDGLGNLYGTTEIGGAFNKGTVYEVSPNGDGTWTEHVLYSFTGRGDGGIPIGGVVIDPNGNLYGSTIQGGLDVSTGGTKCSVGCGVVFKLRKNTDDSWSERPLYKFAGPPADGQAPLGGLVRDKRGNLYGVTELGGAADMGTVFEIGQTDGGETLLHTFTGGPTDGESPESGLVMDRWGVLYGTTIFGGAGSACDCGTVFKITP